MLRKLAAATGAALFAVGLNAAPSPGTETPAAGTDVPVELFVANRGRGSDRPPAATPPEIPGSPPPGEHPNPPPVEAPPPSPPPALPPAPPPVETGPTPTTAPAEFVGPVETVRPSLRVPEDAPTRLPQTGRGSRPLTAAGGGSLLAAGLAVIGGARHRRRASRPVRRRW